MARTGIPPRPSTSYGREALLVMSEEARKLFQFSEPEVSMFDSYRVHCIQQVTDAKHCW